MEQRVIDARDQNTRVVQITATTIGNVKALDTTIQGGTVTIPNLIPTGPILVTGFTVTDVSAEFPTTNQTGRAELSIRNNDLVEPVYQVNTVGISLIAAGINAWAIDANQTENFTLDDNNKLILVAAAGKSVSVTIREIKGA